MVLLSANSGRHTRCIRYLSGPMPRAFSSNGDEGSGGTARVLRGACFLTATLAALSAASLCPLLVVRMPLVGPLSLPTTSPRLWRQLLHLEDLDSRNRGVSSTTGGTATQRALRASTDDARGVKLGTRQEYRASVRWEAGDQNQTPFPPYRTPEERGGRKTKVDLRRSLLGDSGSAGEATVATLATAPSAHSNSRYCRYFAVRLSETAVLVLPVHEVITQAARKEQAGASYISQQYEYNEYLHG